MQTSPRGAGIALATQTHNPARFLKFWCITHHDHKNIQRKTAWPPWPVVH